MKTFIKFLGNMSPLGHLVFVCWSLFMFLLGVFL